MSKIHFPGLGTLRLTIWATYFLIFPILLDMFFKFCWIDFSGFFVYFPLGLPSNMGPIGPVWAGPYWDQRQIVEEYSGMQSSPHHQQGVPLHTYNL